MAAAQLLIARLALPGICRRPAAFAALVLATLIFPDIRPVQAADQIFVEDSAYGKTIQTIEFDTPVNLSYSELMFGIPIRRTNRLYRGDLEAAVAALREREIFSDITVRVADAGDGIRVSFELSPISTISEAIFRGYHLLDEQRLRRLAGLRLGTSIPAEELDAAVQRIKVGYQNYGIYAPTISYVLETTTFESMSVVDFTIEEGEQTKIGEVQVDGDFPSDVAYLRERFIKKAVGTAATKSDIAALKQELLLALRQEGYLQASVEVTKSDYLLLTGQLRLDVKVRTRDPIGIHFVGNTVFSEKELLESLKIATRTVPFSPNAIDTLAREINELYQTHGYYFATVVSESLPSDTTRRLYQISIYEGPRTSIGALKFRGNTRFTIEELEAVVETKPAGFWLFRNWSPGYLVQNQIDDDIAAIEALYQDAGYRGTKAAFEVAEISGANQLEVTINIVEGAPEISNKVTIRFTAPTDKDEVLHSGGQSEVGLQAIKPELDLAEPISQQRLEKERLRILKQIISLGYPRAEVATNVENGGQSVEYVVSAGPHVVVGTIYLAGNMFTRDFVIRRELLITSGGPWDRDLVQLTEQKLAGLGLFRSAQIEPLDGVLNGPVEDVVVKVSERESGNLDAGIAYDTEDGIHLSGRIGNRNFDGEGRDLSLGIDGYIKSGNNIFDAGHIQLAYRIPKAFYTDGDLYLEAFGQYSIELIDQYDYNRTGVGSSYRMPLTERLSTTVGIREMVDNLYNVQPDVIIGPDDEGSTFYSILHGSLDYEHRDDIYNPHQGYRSALQYSLASQALGSEADFVGATWKNSYYIPVSSTLVWANSLSLEALEPIGGNDTIPLDQRIFLGGRGSLRGFSRNSIGPRGYEKDIAGGDRGVIFNSEMQYEFAENIVGVTFLDIGQAFLINQGTFDPAPDSTPHLRYSPGFGLRYLTPIGPVCAEYGFATDRSFGERFGRFTLAVGGAF